MPPSKISLTNFWAGILTFAAGVVLAVFTAINDLDNMPLFCSGIAMSVMGTVSSFLSCVEEVRNYVHRLVVVPLRCVCASVRTGVSTLLRGACITNQPTDNAPEPTEDQIRTLARLWNLTETQFNNLK